MDGWYQNWFAYMERGISKKYFLCPVCYDNKVTINNYSETEEKRNAAIAKIQKKIIDKSATMQEIVNGWIEGVENNYYPVTRDLVYCVEGPEASMFLFKDHLTILSTLETERSGTLDYALFYKCRAHISERKIGNVNNFFFRYNNEISDFDKLNGNVEVEKIKYGSAFTKTELNISIGEYGTLVFYANAGARLKLKGGYTFKFYYHQNQLMEEIYNYILKQAASEELDSNISENDTEQVSDKVLLSSSKPADKQEEEAGASYSPADEIRKMKELFDCGIITQEEFDEAKKRLISKL
ncbi:MAG: SHOCT domain-containing protein [Lachnospiraceae bacterium]|nr:SHOCT domain-containing protein [Lachnospiraceae bacterium]